MAGNDPLYDVWWSHAEAEETMEAEHAPMWEEIIGLIREDDLTDATVLDFGCNRGGFLRHLHARKPFRSGVGIDLGTASIQLANERKGKLPLTYVATGSPEALATRFDLGFCLSVIYLIGDLPEHAHKVKQSLRPGGVYYVTYTDLSDNPSAVFFKAGIEEHTSLTAHLHTLDDIASAFTTLGFQAELMRRVPRGFVALGGESEFFHSVQDQLKAQYEQTYLFRFSLPQT
ncbi:class I SAM-dependent methyltransferase [Paenibacillus daejeonensis]|uniref:class I SAM-dependent methyltransferase n=1 Tax=Paenibacillus daejeonensis TaxID=135193 RepID=UPI0003795880|nr:class I SAM-dependent methyltransferase [Paenibacillus daejeonensis]